MIANFSLERVNDSPASFDPDKLYWLAGEYMRLLPLEERASGVIPYLERAKLISTPVSEDLKNKVRRIVEACGDRLKLFSDILPYGSFFFRDPEYDSSAVEKRLRKPGVADQLRRFAQEFLWHDMTFTAASIEGMLTVFCQNDAGVKRDLVHALRVATTGVQVGPGVFDCVEVLGRDESLRRITKALAIAAGESQWKPETKELTFKNGARVYLYNSPDDPYWRIRQVELPPVRVLSGKDRLSDNATREFKSPQELVDLLGWELET
jgi:glutamyl-tRNA synthetase